MYLIAGRGRKGVSRKKTSGATASHSQSHSVQHLYPGSEDLDFSHDYEHEHEHGDIDEADLNDAGLLGEFEALRAAMGLSQATEAHQKQMPAQPRQSEAQAEHALVEQPKHIDGTFSDDDQALEAVVVTDEDMNDPHLLAELTKISQSDAREAAQNVIYAEADASDTKAETETKSELEQKPAQDNKEEESKRMETLTVLAERVSQFRSTALAAKKAGDMDAARSMLLKMRDAQSAISILQSGSSLPSDYVVPPPPPSQPLPPSSSAASKELTIAKKQPVQSSVKTQTAPASTKTAAPLTKTATSATKTTAAKTELLTSHCAESRLREVTTESFDRSFEEIAKSFAAMKTKLESQSAEAAKMAAYFLKTGDKAMALEFHRLRKSAVADLAVVASYEANGRPLPPPFLHREVRWSAPGEQQRDISASELQIAIRRMVSAGDLAATLGGQSDFYIQWETTWPKDKGSKAYTRTMRFREFDESQGDLEIGYTKNVEFVDRQYVRPLLRWIERGKLTIELYKYMGILWGSQLIGRATLPLADLRSSSEVAALVEFKAVSASLGRADRSLVGGAVFVDVAARLRLPLSNKPEKVVYSERWIYIGSNSEQQEQQGRGVMAQEQPPLAQEQPPASAAEAVRDAPLSPRSDMQPQSQLSQLSLPLPPPVPSQEQDKEQPTAPRPHSKEQTHTSEATSAATAATNASSTAEDIAAQMDIMETTVSNAVLELELLQIPARIRATKDKNEISELEDLESSIKLRMSVVAAQVGAGIMTIRDYINSVEKEIAQNKEWALAAKRQGRKDLAVRALKRIKAMQNELNEMKQAMENDEEEEEAANE
ncbi:hypothetical protein LPJ64_002270 [Coemansia asiatica]|uniref:DM14 domain-containing protein n=1 Tax=Coemansia asiatica TaxID=1052880 RepID=A0A9W7XNH3_9FUNG|nr:hypothetical protein LPJ64_002270 [Coemansia asiatica]